MDNTEDIKQALMLYDTIAAPLCEHMGTTMPNYNQKITDWVSVCKDAEIPEDAFLVANEIRQSIGRIAAEAERQLLTGITDDQ